MLSSSGSVTNPVEIPATGLLIGTPASINANVLPQILACEVEPFEDKTSETILIAYGNSLNDEVKNSKLSSEQIANIVKNETDTESASSNLGKTVEEQEEKQNITNTQANTANTVSNTNSVNSNTNVTSQVNTTSNSKQAAATAKSTSEKPKEENQKELSFQMPIEGEVVREFAQDNLVYSDTLEEWVTHSGIDIKAEKTTIVQAAEDGTVKTIKNDPRYGLTIVIEHENGFQTVYANLLSSEFVTEGEKVIKGQSIGTVGNTAAFESVDEPHLHFEVLKDMVQVDPSIYVK